MKHFYQLLAAAMILTCTSIAQARDEVADYSIAEALSSESAKSLLGDNVKFYFGDQEHGPIEKEFSEYSTNKKTNGTNKTNKEACEWVFLSALIALRDQATQVGANAVVNIRSNYRNNTTSSATTFKCGSGMLMSGVALKGDIVRLQ